MAVLNSKITEEDLDFVGAELEFFNRNARALKADLLKRYDPKMAGRTVKSKKVNALLSMFTASPEETAKQNILDECSFSCRWLHSTYFNYATYRALAILTFPIVYELMKIISSYGDKFFTPESVSASLTIPFESEATKADKVYKALKLMETAGIVKKIKRGLFKAQKLPLLDVQGIEAILLAAAELNDGTDDSVHAVLNGLSFEITHEFYDYYRDIPYDKIIPAKVLAPFKVSSSKHTLQYINGSWEVSNDEYLYQPINKPKIAFNPRCYFNVEQIKQAKMRKKLGEARVKKNSNVSKV